MLLLQQHGFKITYITGWRAYLGSAQHNYPHWTRVELPEGRHDLATLERIPGVLPFEVYAQAPLRLISWCSFELDNRSKALLREPAIQCKSLTTSTEQLVAKKAQYQTYALNKTLSNTWPRLPQSRLHQEPKCPITLQWSNTFRDTAAANGNLHTGLLLLLADAQP